MSNIFDFCVNNMLQDAVNRGIIDISDVQEQLIMKKTNEILNAHKYKVWQGDNGSWYTYLPDESKKNGRRLIKKKSKEKIHETIIKFYDTGNKREDTFKHLFLSYRKLKSEVVSNNTISKYDSDYKRFFAGTWLETADIKGIAGDKLEAFIIKRIKDLQLNSKAAKAMIGYIKGAFTHAIINEKITKNPCIYLKSNSNYLRYCCEDAVNLEDRIANSKEIATVLRRIKQDHIRKPYYIPSYAVELSILTGMRVGEISALRWDAIKDGSIIIKREEIYDRTTNEYYIDEYPKNKKSRVIPVTEEIKTLLDRVENVEKMFGYYGEFIFMNDKGRVNKRTISDCARNKSYQSGLEKSKCIQCYRRTINSTMKCSGVSDVIVTSLIGNTEEVNKRHYTYDITDMDQKRVVLENANKIMLSEYQKGNHDI